MILKFALFLSIDENAGRVHAALRNMADAV